MKSNVLGAVSIGVATRGLAIASGFLFTSVLSFFVTPEAYGFVATAISAALLACAAGEFGQREYQAREISKLLAVGDERTAKRNASASTILACIGGLLAGLVVGGLLLVLTNSLLAASVSACLTLLLSVNGAWSGIGRAHDQMFWAIAPREVFWRLGSLAIVLAAAKYTGENVGSGLALPSLVVSLAACLGMQFLAIGRDKFDTQSLRALRTILVKRQVLAASRDIAITNVGGLVLVTLDVVLVGLFMGERSAAEYYPANRLAVLTFTVFVTFHLALTPRISTALHLGEMQRACDMARIGARISAASALAGLIALYLARPILPLVFDTATNTTWIATLILSAGFVINALLAFNGVMLIAAGYERVVRRIMLWVLPFGVVTLALAAWWSSLIGVAMVVLIVSTARLVAETIACKKYLGVTIAF